MRVRNALRRSTAGTTPNRRRSREVQPSDVRDPTNKKYQLKAAWAYINRPVNAGKYSDEEVRAIKIRIPRAAKARGVALPGSPRVCGADGSGSEEAEVGCCLRIGSAGHPWSIHLSPSTPDS